MPEHVPLLVFSDLDGTLLDHETYDWLPAVPALGALARIGAPVVLASSKTAAEIAPLQAEMGLQGLPAIVENGAGVIGLDETAPAGRDYDDLRAAVAGLDVALRGCFRGFGDMTCEDVARVTGLTLSDAARAKTRRFSEPGLWEGSERAQEAFLQALKARGITGRKGGRFLTLSKGATKADRMAQVIAYFRPAQTLALGDAPNDTEMLQAADTGIIIANPHGTPLPVLDGERTGRVIRTERPGPAGWNAAVLEIVEALKTMTGPPPNG